MCRTEMHALKFCELLCGKSFPGILFENEPVEERAVGCGNGIRRGDETVRTVETGLTTSVNNLSGYR